MPQACRGSTAGPAAAEGGSWRWGPGLWGWWGIALLRLASPPAMQGAPRPAASQDLCPAWLYSPVFPLPTSRCLQACQCATPMLRSGVRSGVRSGGLCSLLLPSEQCPPSMLPQARSLQGGREDGDTHPEQPPSPFSAGRGDGETHTWSSPPARSLQGGGTSLPSCRLFRYHVVSLSLLQPVPCPPLVSSLHQLPASCCIQPLPQTHQGLGNLPDPDTWHSPSSPIGSYPMLARWGRALLRGPSCNPAQALPLCPLLRPGCPHGAPLAAWLPSFLARGCCGVARPPRLH